MCLSSRTPQRRPTREGQSTRTRTKPGGDPNSSKTISPAAPKITTRGVACLASPSSAAPNGALRVADGHCLPPHWRRRPSIGRQRAPLARPGPSRCALHAADRANRSVPGRSMPETGALRWRMANGRTGEEARGRLARDAGGSLFAPYDVPKASWNRSGPGHAPGHALQDTKQRKKEKQAKNHTKQAGAQRTWTTNTTTRHEGASTTVSPIDGRARRMLQFVVLIRQKMGPSCSEPRLVQYVIRM